MIHACLFLVATILNFAFVWRVKPFNYERFNLWSNVLNGGVIWLCLMGILTEGGAPRLPILCLIFIGLAIVVFYGLLIQHKGRKGKYRELLYLPKSHKIENLFRYQFGLEKDEIKSTFAH